MNAGRWDSALQLCGATDVHATDFSAVSSAASVLEYLCQAGTVYAVGEKYPQARAALATCLSLPTEAVSPLQHVAHKRLILASLLADADASGILDEVSPSLRPEYMRESKSYDALAAAYARTDSGDALVEAAQLGAGVFAEDRNELLVQRCIERHPRYRLAAVSKFVKCVSLHDLALFLGVPQERVRAELDALVAEGDIAVTFSEPSAQGPPFPGVVRDDTPAPIVSFARAGFADPKPALLGAIAESEKAVTELHAARAAAAQAPAVLSRVWLLHSGMSVGLPDEPEGEHAC